MWYVVVGGWVIVDPCEDPSTNNNLPHRQVVAQIMHFVVTLDFFIYIYIYIFFNSVGAISKDALNPKCLYTLK